MVVGYVRVSTVDQNMDRQVRSMEEYHVERIFQEKISGKNTDRPELQKMLDFVREGDTVVVCDFSRLSRSARDLLTICDRLEQKKVKLISLKENLDTSTSTGKFMLTIIGALAELERSNILERQREGIAIAKEKGVYQGRKPLQLDNFEQTYMEWKNKKITATEACKILHISRGTFYNS